LGAAQAAGGVLEAAGGVVLAGGGALLSRTGVGAVPGLPTVLGGTALAVNGVDNAITGLKTALTGEFQHNLVSEAAGETARLLGPRPRRWRASRPAPISPPVLPAWALGPWRQPPAGRTPGKRSRTGREVIARMRAEGKIRTNSKTGVTEFLASDGEWYDIAKADMAHKYDAVTWWNSTGRQYGARAPEARKWMLDPDNYYLELASINRSQGARLGKTETYLPPLK